MLSFKYVLAWVWFRFLGVFSFDSLLSLQVLPHLKQSIPDHQ